MAGDPPKMLSISEDTDNTIGYSFSEMETGFSDSSTDDISSSGGSSCSTRKSESVDEDIAQLTKLQSGASPRTPVSTLKMLAGREANLSGRGRFSTGDCRYVLSRYLPVNGPWTVDQMSTRAYVSHFSADGSLLVAAFQVLITLRYVKCLSQERRTHDEFDQRNLRL